MIQICVDLDGVLNDLHKGLQDQLGFVLPQERTPENKIIAENMFDIVAQTPNFWLNCPLMPDARMLWEGIKEICPLPYIITATPEHYGFDIRHDECGADKILWVYKHFGPKASEKTIFTKSRKKWEYLKPIQEFTMADKIVLIDDMPKNINDWNNNGGVGILHTSAIDTVQKLKEIHANN